MKKNNMAKFKIKKFKTNESNNCFYVAIKVNCFIKIYIWKEIPQ